MNNQENKMLTVWFFTLISYAVAYFIIRNSFVLLFSYFIFFYIYSKLYNYIYKLLQKKYNQESFSQDCK